MTIRRRRTGGGGSKIQAKRSNIGRLESIVKFERGKKNTRGKEDSKGKGSRAVWLLLSVRLFIDEADVWVRVFLFTLRVSHDETD